MMKAAWSVGLLGSLSMVAPLVQADTLNLRTDLVAQITRETHLELDYYLNERVSVGLVGRIGPAKANGIDGGLDDFYLAGVRINRFFNDHRKSDWFFSIQGYYFQNPGCTYYSREALTDKTDEPIRTYEDRTLCDDSQYIGVEFLQSYQVMFGEHLNFNVGIGGKANIALKRRGSEPTELAGWVSYESDNDSVLGWGESISPAMEFSLGWKI